MTYDLSMTYDKFSVIHDVRFYDILKVFDGFVKCIGCRESMTFLEIFHCHGLTIITGTLINNIK